jgi:hypothetical protein
MLTAPTYVYAHITIVCHRSFTVAKGAEQKL